MLKGLAFFVPILFAAACAFGAWAQGYPAKPIRLVVPFAAGSSAELTYRPVAEQVATTLGASVIVEPRPGGATMAASQYVKSQPADGYTIYGVSSTVAVKSVIPGAQIDIRKDFTPIALSHSSHLLFVVNPDVTKARTLKDFLAEAQSRPGELNYGSYGIGSGSHVLMEMCSSGPRRRWCMCPIKARPRPRWKPWPTAFRSHPAPSPC
jgi:tripartite-type tricarboxylate transporter receptor subunit TctC